jgi:GDP-L-fucose synthase
MNILITGGNGYIATSLYGMDIAFEDNITAITRKDFDLTDRHATNKWFEGKHFDVVIHTAVKGGSRLLVDGGNIFYENIQMFYNLLNNKHCFSKLIHFGSGAELNMPSDPYGLSKNIISRIIDNEDNFYNIRIYGVFDKNELDTRFIKSNIKRYINKQPIEIHQDKLMDFFYMEDLVKLVKCYTRQGRTHYLHLPKNIDCTYETDPSLSDIANIINNLSNYKVKINIGEGRGKDYVGYLNPLNIKWVGLEQGIKKTYKKLLNETN